MNAFLLPLPKLQRPCLALGKESGRVSGGKLIKFIEGRGYEILDQKISHTVTLDSGQSSAIHPKYCLSVPINVTPAASALSRSTGLGCDSVSCLCLQIQRYCFAPDTSILQMNPEKSLIFQYDQLFLVVRTGVMTSNLFTF